MAAKTGAGLAPAVGVRDPFSLLRRMTAELDGVFDAPFWPSSRSTEFRTVSLPEATEWAPKVDLFERDGRLITRVDLPGVKLEDLNVEVTDGHIALFGERKYEKEETKDNVYRSEREHGRFYRAVPLPDGAKVEDVKAVFADGVLEVSVPLPVKPEARSRKVEIQDGKSTKPVAA